MQACICAPTVEQAKCTVLGRFGALRRPAGLCYVLRRPAGCVTCYSFRWAPVLRVTAFRASCVTLCYVLQLFRSVTLDGVESLFFVAVARRRSCRPVSLRRLRRRPSSGGALLLCLCAGTARKFTQGRNALHCERHDTLLPSYSTRLRASAPPARILHSPRLSPLALQQSLIFREGACHHTHAGCRREEAYVLYSSQTSNFSIEHGPRDICGCSCNFRRGDCDRLSLLASFGCTKLTEKLFRLRA